MILRTPIRKRRAESPQPESASGRRLVIYEDPASPPLDSPHHPSEQMLCTYQCRQMVKSEFLDTLMTTEKLVSDYQSNLETSNVNLSKAEADGKKYHDQLLYAEQELAATRGREQALQEQLLKEINGSKERLHKQMHMCSEAEGKLQKEINLRKTAEISAASAEEKANLLEQKLKHLSDSIERETKNLKDELKHLQGESKLSVSRIKADLERMECRAHNAEKESLMYKEQMEEVKKQFRECLFQKSELENKITMDASPLKCSTGNSSAILVKQLQEELRNYVSSMITLFICCKHFSWSTVCKGIDKIVRNFMGCSTPNSRHTHLLRWDIVTSPVDEGGLGVRSMQTSNQAILARLGWRLINRPDSLWSRTIRGNNCSGRLDVDMFQNKRNASRLWKGIVKGADILCPGLRTSVGNGKTTLFWTHRWLTPQPLEELASGPIPDSIMDSTVEETWNENDWKWEALTN